MLTHRMPWRRTSRGFTLIELLVAISLVGVMLKLGVPAFNTWIRNSQIRTVTDALQTGIRTAQAEAVRLNRGTVFFLTNSAASPNPGATAAAGGVRWSVQSIALAAISTDAAQVLANGSLTDVAKGVTIAGTDSSGSINAICFNSNGFMFAPSAPGVSGAVCGGRSAVFDISQPNPVAGVDRPLRVQVSLGGQLRVCDPARTLSATAMDGC